MNNLDTRLTLLEKIKNRHNDNAWEEFIFYYQKYINIILKNMSVTPDDMKELSQLIIIKLWEKLPDFDFAPKKARFRTWLCRVIQNETSNFFRKKNALKRSQLSGQSDNDFEIPCDSELDILVEREWNIYVTQLALNNIMQRLPDRFRPAFELLLKGKSTQEIMDETGLVYNTVAVYLKRSKEKVKAEIKRLNNELL